MSLQAMRQKLEVALTEAETGRYEEVWVEPEIRAITEARKALEELVYEIEHGEDDNGFARLAGLDQEKEYRKAMGTAA